MKAIQITLIENSKSYESNNEQRVTRIEVESKHEESYEFKNETIESYMKKHRKNYLNNVFKSFNQLEIKEVA